MSADQPQRWPGSVVELLETVGPSHGVDVDGNGLLRESRLHQLVRQDGEVREHTVQITFLESGAEAYVFTFG